MSQKFLKFPIKFPIAVNRLEKRSSQQKAQRRRREIIEPTLKGEAERVG